MKKISFLLVVTIFCLAGCKKGDHDLIRDPKASIGGSLDTTHVIPPPVYTGRYLGVTCGFNYSSGILTGPVPPELVNQQNRPLYNPDPNNPSATWGEWVSQLGQAGVDFICPNLRGSQPNTGVSPVTIQPLIAAINARGLTNQLKIAAFDDNASSWTAQWNMANGRGFGGAQPMDMSDSNNWKYIYDYNYKLFFQTVPDANLFKINNQPVIIIWSAATVFITNDQGNVSRAMLYVRRKCQQDFGFNPFIILSKEFFDRDSTCYHAGVADGMQNWFNYPSNYSLAQYNGAKVGVAVSQFSHPNNPNDSRYLDPNHGVLFDNGLNSTVGAGALLTLCEGFTDYEEDASMWRVRNIDENGNVLTYQQTGYDYPNQRINLLRKYSSNPFPSVYRLEAEGCDYYGGAAGGNGQTNFYRNGNIAIAPTNDTSGAFQVGWIANNQWLEWEGVPMGAGATSLSIRIANPNPNMFGHIEIDGTALPSVTFPNTGGWDTWQTFNMGVINNSAANSYHKIRIVFETGNVNVNWIKLSRN